MRGRGRFRLQTPTALLPPTRQQELRRLHLLEWRACAHPCRHSHVLRRSAWAGRQALTDRLGNLSSGSNLRASGAEVVDWSFPSRGRALRRPGYYDARPPPPRLAAILLLIRTQWAEPGAGPSGRCGAAAAGLSHCAACQGAGRSLEAREPSSRGEPRALAAQAGPVSARSRAAGPAERRRARTGAVRRGWAAAERTARPPCGVAGAARRRRGGRRAAGR